MLDLLLIPAALMLALALRAVRQGDHRLHGHLMTAAITIVALRVILHPRPLHPAHLLLWVGTLVVAGATLLLGRAALGWREGRHARAALARIHRASGALTLIGLVLTTFIWLLRHRQ